MDNIIIAVDAMGGDGAPQTAIDGCRLALRAHEDLRIRLFGRKEDTREAMARLEGDAARVECIEAEEVISMHDEPMLAVRRKRNSSMVMGLMDVKEKRSRAFVSAGSTGALFLGGMAYVRLLRGIDRPALAPVLPGIKKPFLLIDSGANADCQPQYLLQFGLMGHVYMQRVLGVETPRVGLVNIGVESEKGNRLVKEAYARMRAQSAYQFAGNCEARDLYLGDFDVAVTDGFTGNVILKSAEGFSSALFSQIKGEVRRTNRGKLGGYLLKPAFGRIRRRMNADEYGGAPLLGLDGAVVKAHGASNAYAFSMAISQARDMARGDVVGQIRAGLSALEIAASN